MYSYGSPHTAAQKQDDQHERTFSSYVRIQVVVLKTYLGRWTIGRSGERGSGISVLPARYDDDDIYPILPPWTGQFVKKSATGLNSEFSFTGCLTKVKVPSLSYNLSIAGRKTDGFIPFPWALVQRGMQTVSLRNWTLINNPIFMIINVSTIYQNFIWSRQNINVAIFTLVFGKT